MTHFIHANSGSSNSHFLLKYCLYKLLIYILRHRPNMMDKSLNSESAQEWTWIFFWSLRTNRSDSWKSHQEHNGRVSGQMRVIFISWQFLPNPLPSLPIPLGPGLIIGRLQGITELEWTVSASLKNALHSTSIVKQSKEGFHVRSTNICISLLLCLPQLNIFGPLPNIWKTGYNKFADDSCDWTWGKQTVKFNDKYTQWIILFLPLIAKLIKNFKFPYTSNIDISEVKEICEFPSLFSDHGRQITFEKAGSTHSWAQAGGAL